MKPREFWLRKVREYRPTFHCSQKPYGPGYEAIHVREVMPDGEIERLEKQLRFCAGYISATEGHTHKHPEEVLEWIRVEALK